MRRQWKLKATIDQLQEEIAVFRAAGREQISVTGREVSVTAGSEFAESGRLQRATRTRLRVRKGGRPPGTLFEPCSSHRRLTSKRPSITSPPDADRCVERSRLRWQVHQRFESRSVEGSVETNPAVRQPGHPGCQRPRRRARQPSTWPALEPPEPTSGRSVGWWMMSAPLNSTIARPAASPRSLVSAATATAAPEAAARRAASAPPRALGVCSRGQSDQGQRHRKTAGVQRHVLARAGAGRRPAAHPPAPVRRTRRNTVLRRVSFWTSMEKGRRSSPPGCAGLRRRRYGQSPAS